MNYAQKTEFRLLSRIIGENLAPVYPYEVAGVSQEIKAQDFDGRVDVIPVSDPNIFSMAQRVTLAQTQLQLAQTNPQIHNLHSAYRRMYQALEVQNIEDILPPPKKPVPTDPAIENARALGGELLQAFPEQSHDAHMAVHIQFMKTPMVLTSPQVMGTMYGHLLEHIAYKARMLVEREVTDQITELDVATQQGKVSVQDAQNHVNQLESAQQDPKQVEDRVAQLEVETMQTVFAQLAPPPGANEDPLVKIRMQELAIKQQQVANDSELEQEKLLLEQMKMQQRAATDAARLELQEEIADDRNEVNRERIDVQRQSTLRRQ